MIKTRQLVKRFETFTALDNLDTHIQAGSIYGLVGSNGSGKSTFLRLVAGVYQPDGGEITVNGMTPFENTQVKNELFFVADELYFLPQSTLEEMAMFYESFYSNFSRERYRKLCEIFPLDVKKKLSQFSKGMRRQAALLLGLSCQPSLLLLDEAFDGLDPVIRGAVKKLLMDDMGERGLTVVVSSHNLRELEDLCDHVGLLHKGKILFEQEIDELKLGFSKVQAAFPQGIEDEVLKKLPVMQIQRTGSVIQMIVRTQSQEACAFLTEQGAAFAEGVPLTLEEVFVHEMEAVGYDYSNIIF